MIGEAPNVYYRAVWVVLFLGCMIMLYLNAQSVLDKYNRNEKIVDIQLKFGSLKNHVLLTELFYFQTLHLFQQLRFVI